MDEHFRSAPMERNIPILMGLLGVWNMSFLNYNSRTCLPYAEALLKLPAHIQQLGKCSFDLLIYSFLTLVSDLDPHPKGNHNGLPSNQINQIKSDMESNGKSMTKFGIPVDYGVGEIDFGEPGTNGQHSFYQLLHMGQTVPCDFIGFVQSQQDLCLDNEKLSSHDELMANFFATTRCFSHWKDCRTGSK